MIRRRTLLAGAVASLVVPRDVGAQAPARVARVGWLWDTFAGPQPPSWREAFRDELRQHGWIDGQNVTLYTRAPDATGLAPSQRDPTLKALTAELIGLNVDVIVANPASAAQASKAVSARVPARFQGEPRSYVRSGDPA